MADPILHRGCQMACSLCGAMIRVAAPNNRVLKSGVQEALVVGDTFTPTPACNGPNLKPPAGPCTGVRWEGASPVLSANGARVLLQTSTGHLLPETPPPRQIQITAPPAPPTHLHA